MCYTEQGTGLIGGVHVKSIALYESINRATGSYPFFGEEINNFNFISHFHEELEAVIVLEGTIQISTNEGLQTVSQDEICFIMPGVIHGFISKSSSRLFLIKLPLVSEVENITLPFTRIRCSIITPTHSCYPELKKLIFEMNREHAEKRFGYEFAVKSAQFRLITILLRNLPHNFINADENEHFRSGMQLLRAVNEYIEKHYAHEIKLNDVAAYCKYSVYYFSHCFKNAAGASFCNYLTVFRLKKAVTLMTDTDAKMSEIAFACGFNDIRSFNRMFKKHFTATPTNYRKSLDSQVSVPPHLSES